MERERVVSSNLASVGYDVESQALEVEFSNGTIYLYRDVPAKVHQELINAPSIGSYFTAAIRRGPYNYTRIK